MRSAWARSALWPLCAAAILSLLSGCAHPRTSALAASPPVAAATSADVQTDPDFLFDGSVLSSRNLLYVELTDARRAAALAPGPERARLLRTVAMVRAAQRDAGQATLFRCRIRRNDVTITPEHPPWRGAPQSTIDADIAISGAEISSLCTALSAARQGYRVAVVYAGPLGGLSTDEGGNLRYFDCVIGTPRTDAERTLFRAGFGMTGTAALPDKMDARLRAFFAKVPSIRFIHMASYDGLRVDVSSGRIAQIVTEEGVGVRARRFFDTDPECRVGEKAGLPLNIDTPHLSEGLVFDVRGLTPDDWTRLQAHDRITPDALRAFADVAPGAATDARIGDARIVDARIAHAAQRLQHDIATDTFFVGQETRFGYRALAQGFLYYMLCREQAASTPDLVWLNTRRRVSGFNVAVWNGTATFNSVSYQMGKTLEQHAHNIATNAEYAPLMRTEKPALEDYLRYVTGDPDLTVRLPPQLYVREATAFVPITHPYHLDEFTRPIPPGSLFTIYAMDLRDMQPRDAENARAVRAYLSRLHGHQRWPNRADATFTTIPNLFLLNKCAVTPAFFGGQRIEQNQINTGEMLVRYLAFDKRRTR